MKLSVVVRARNEYPIVLCTINSLLEDLEYCGEPWELIVVGNCCTDPMVDVLQDRYRRWISAGLLRVLEFNEKGSCGVAINTGWQASTGDVLFVADAHISIARGTIGLLARGARERGGIWHAPIQMWGDLDRTKLYGMHLSLRRNFWGGPCRVIPKGAKPDEPWPIPMAGACLYAVARGEVEARGLYSPAFKSYGGIEPYLCFKWWTTGSAVWMEPRALCRHAFGIEARWQKVKRLTTKRNEVYLRGGRITRNLKPGDEYLAYGAGYRIGNEEFYFNFLLAAWAVGGHLWLDRITESFRPRCRDVDKLKAEVLQCEDARLNVAPIQRTTLDALLAEPPWLTCGLHDEPVEP